MLNYTWLPADTACNSNALKVVKANGSHLILDSGTRVYDAVSSWWCKPLGHRHQLVSDSITQQLLQFEHHIPAGLYNDVIEGVSAKLIKLSRGMDRVMYASDGSSAIEVAMKLSYEYRLLNNEPAKTKFIALANAYHGETIFTLSVCGIKSYKQAYTPFLMQNYFINDVCYVSSRHDPLWDKCNTDIKALEEYIAGISSEVTALLIEPIVQGAGGLKIISKDFLAKLIQIAQKYKIHVICDEIMVGLGRIGYSCVTSELIGGYPEFICVAKNLTAGSIPMSAVIISHKISGLFRQHNTLFPHSHTHSCNTLAASVANNYLSYLEQTQFKHNILKAEPLLFNIFKQLSLKYDFIQDVRGIGGVAACSVNLPSKQVAQIHNLGIKHGIYLRPIGTSLYLMPPLYNLEHDIAEITTKLSAVLADLTR